MGFTQTTTTSTLVIAAAGTTSTSVFCDGAVPILILWPAAMTATAATLQVSTDDATWATVQALTGGTDYAVAVGASEAQPLDPAVTAGINGLYVRIVAGSAEAAERTVTLIRRPV